MASEILSAAVSTLGAMHEDLPDELEDDDDRLLWDRFLSLATEQADAVVVLSHAGLWRPAYGMLRMLLETLGTFCWIRTACRYRDLFLNGTQPNMRSQLEAIGWGEEYERTYGFLSSLVHVSERQLHAYKWVDVGEDGLLPDFEGQDEYYIIPTEDGLQAFSVRDLTHDQAEDEYLPFLEAKMFDLVISAMFDIYGRADALAMEIFPRKGLQAVGALLYEHPNLVGEMLSRIDNHPGRFARGESGQTSR